MDNFRPGLWARLWGTLRRRPPRDPDARLSPTELQAVIDRINDRVREDHATRAEKRANKRDSW